MMVPSCCYSGKIRNFDAKRLATAGWGQEKSIADNNTEDGKAKNRRVELVKQ